MQLKILNDMMNNKILIVDDEVEICLLLSTYLKSKGFDTNYANSVQEGINKLDEYHPDIAILDVNLPDGLGFDLIPKARVKAETKIIIISARDGEQEQRLSKLHDVDEYITKPFKQKDILNIIEKFSQS